MTTLSALLPLLLKLLPFDLRTSAFRATDERFRAFARSDADAFGAQDQSKMEDDYLG